jgi:hypothetical protein
MSIEMEQPPNTKRNGSLEPLKAPRKGGKSKDEKNIYLMAKRG